MRHQVIQDQLWSYQLRRQYEMQSVLRAVLISDEQPLPLLHLLLPQATYRYNQLGQKSLHQLRKIMSGQSEYLSLLVEQREVQKLLPQKLKGF